MLKTSAERSLMNGSYEAEVRFDNSAAYYGAISQLFTLNDIADVVSDAAASSGMSGAVNTRKYIRYLSDSLYIIHITMLPSE